MGASNAHRNLVREMGPECRCAVRNATATRVGACVRRVGCKTYTCSPPQDATLPEGVAVRHVMGRAEAHRGSLHVLGGHGDGGRVHYTARVVHPSAGASSRLDALCIFFSVGVSQGPRRLMAEAAGAHLVGVGHGQFLRVPKHGRLDRLGGDGRGEMRHKGGCGGLAGGAP